LQQDFYSQNPQLAQRMGDGGERRGVISRFGQVIESDYGNIFGRCCVRWRNAAPSAIWSLLTTAFMLGYF
jgi:hypothetical protein